MAIHKLTDRKVNTAKAGKHEDGGGLRLVVSKNGSKRWVLRFTLNNKRREMGLGRYPAVSLRQARELTNENNALIAQSEDPILHRKRLLTTIPTFRDCANEYIETHKSAWSNEKHITQWVNTINSYANPIIGELTIDKIGTEHILSIVKPIWNTKTETAKRIQGRLENILDFSAAKNQREQFNPARWRGHLDKLLPKPSKVKRVVHLPAMPYEDIPQFILELSRNTSASSLALQFLILTATRTSETLNAQWNEIDLTNCIWTIPADRMKAKKEHRVPLSAQAINTLQRVKRIQNNPYIFTGNKIHKPLSNMALLSLMRKSGYSKSNRHYVPHGFRSSFRDWCGEVSNHPSDIAEMALAHAIKNKTEAAYRRGDLLEKRKRLMAEWGAYIYKNSFLKSNIISLQNLHNFPNDFDKRFRSF